MVSVTVSSSSSWDSLGLAAELYFLVILAVVLLATVSNSSDECYHKDKPISCFECNSKEHEWCKDPFNYSTVPSKYALGTSCNGCCVKMVTHMKTPSENIRRTCTAEIGINLFMVDYVCMAEGTGTGTMCFCNEDICNSSTSLPSLTIMTLFSLCFLAVLPTVIS